MKSENVPKDDEQSYFIEHHQEVLSRIPAAKDVYELCAAVNVGEGLRGRSHGSMNAEAWRATHQPESELAKTLWSEIVGQALVEGPDEYVQGFRAIQEAVKQKLEELGWPLDGTRE